MRHTRKLDEIGGHAACRAAERHPSRSLSRHGRRDDPARNSWRACRTIVSLRGLCAPTYYVEKAGQKHCGSELNLSRTQPKELRHKNRRDALFASRLPRWEAPFFFVVSSAQAFGGGSATTPHFMASSISSVPSGAASAFLHIRRPLGAVGAPEVSPARKSQSRDSKCFVGRGFSHDIKIRRAAPSFCAVSPAQAFEVDSAVLPIPPSANFSSPGVTLPPTNNHNSLITAFLIDTLAIRVGLKSFNCNTQVHSNRHSSEPWKLHHNCAYAPSRGREFFLRRPGPGFPATPSFCGQSDWFRRDFTLSSGLLP
jgi:hypothetical protein